MRYGLLLVLLLGASCDRSVGEGYEEPKPAGATGSTWDAPYGHVQDTPFVPSVPDTLNVDAGTPAGDAGTMATADGSTAASVDGGSTEVADADTTAASDAGTSDAGNDTVTDAGEDDSCNCHHCSK
jgi:hypothetical protein